MDRNSIIGFVLIFLILMGYNYYTSPTPEQMAEAQRVEDSIRIERARADSLEALEKAGQLKPEMPVVQTPEQDSIARAQAQTIFADFGASAVGTESDVELKNDLFTVTLTNKGGKIRKVELSQYQKVTEDSLNKELKEDLLLMSDPKNKFNYHLPLAANGRTIQSSDLFFQIAEQSANSVTFRAPAGTGYFEQKYSIKDSTYAIDYDLRFVGLNSVFKSDAENIKLEWVDHLDKLEKNVDFERRYSTVYFKESEDDPDYCSCTSDDEETVEARVDWVSHSNQFFNSSLIADNKPFAKGEFKTIGEEEDSSDLKKLKSEVYIPLDEEQFAMTLYVGPNEWNRLRAFDNSLEDIIPFGTSIFGSVNRWIVRPLFNFLSTFIGSAGIVILILTLIVKLALYPLTYKMIRSQAKMGTLKPEIEKLKNKFKDDPQQQQVETMKMYREYGVNPLGGCMPMLLQMPVWIALYRFFPASIEFRQKSFLWANDLSSYDAAIPIPELPLLGDHLSLFTILWALTTILYSWYNTRLVDMSQGNPMMKYMQYIMPITFIFFFNTYASGLTCYLFFSALLNVGQTVFTKTVLINEDKLKAELKANKEKPKKKSGFAQRLQEAMAEQQKKAEAAQRKQQQKKKRK